MPTDFIKRYNLNTKYEYPILRNGMKIQVVFPKIGTVPEERIKGVVWNGIIIYDDNYTDCISDFNKYGVTGVEKDGSWTNPLNVIAYFETIFDETGKKIWNKDTGAVS